MATHAGEKATEALETAAAVGQRQQRADADAAKAAADAQVRAPPPRCALAPRARTPPSTPTRPRRTH